MSRLKLFKRKKEPVRVNWLIRFASLQFHQRLHRPRTQFKDVDEGPDIKSDILSIWLDNDTHMQYGTEI